MASEATAAQLAGPAGGGLLCTTGWVHVRSKADVVTMRNGDRITCEFLELALGQAT